MSLLLRLLRAIVPPEPPSPDPNPSGGGGGGGDWRDEKSWSERQRDAAQVLMQRNNEALVLLLA
jgi:hypothetical protein